MTAAGRTFAAPRTSLTAPGRKVVRRDAIPDMPDHGDSCETPRHPAIERRLQRVGVHEIRPQPSEPLGETNRVARRGDDAGQGH